MRTLFERGWSISSEIGPTTCEDICCVKMSIYIWTAVILMVAATAVVGEIVGDIWDVSTLVSIILASASIHIVMRVAVLYNAQKMELDF